MDSAQLKTETNIDDIPYDHSIMDSVQIKIENETLHDYNNFLIIECKNSSINSCDSEMNNCETFENKKTKKPKLHCEYCNRVFKKHNLYEDHMRTHTEEDIQKKGISEDGNQFSFYESYLSWQTTQDMEEHQKSEHTRMGSKSFYGNDKHVNPIPGDGFQSDDDLFSDSDTEYVSPNQCLSAVFPGTECNLSGDEICFVQTTKTRTNKTDPKTEINDQNFKFTGITQLPDFIQKLKSPADLFLFLFSDDLIEVMVKQSNLKSIQDNANRPANITKQEMEQFIGIMIFMSIVRLPVSRNYWNSTIGQPQIYESMTCNRFETIKQHLHFNDNTNFIPYGNPGHDKLFKVRPLLDGIRQQLLLVPKEEFLKIEEQIIPTNNVRPNKLGYKNQVLCGVSGFSYDFDIFAGNQSNTHPEDAPDLGVRGNVVTRLTSTIPRHVNHKIVFENYFNSSKLQKHLRKIGLLSLDRFPTATMSSEKEYGHCNEKCTTPERNELSTINRMDKNPVQMLSTESEKSNTKLKYFNTKAVRVSNSIQSIRGNLLDSMLGVHRIHMRSKKWYKRIFVHMVDMCIVNAWILWRKNNPEEYMTLFDFKLAVSDHLCKSGKVAIRRELTDQCSDRTPLTYKSRANPEDPNSSKLESPTQPIKCKLKRARNQELPLNSVRTDNVGHMPEWQKNRQKCKICEYKTYTRCRKCHVFLCYNDKRNCLTRFHEL
ncbi:piggyBac transposable element-derived protein 3-like isoform X2 [Episyrphus balteatus]|nr:piggyBac transposable element-derived protein 3-like isoform X2 [Episyrphus balteatus]XP_055852311.1 piggyBac transposable element-derived protein 3-like isoform X2 [Episyrphus balteatus]XP_055852312.1 piggyBac transposable element-derived protein 3-like isoform X2 [Episyrphus balteatus]XP_055852313.1 piggyBac transposable element-derived protein 3-like isoform X2 [Episyrphus balteatus]